MKNNERTTAQHPVFGEYSFEQTQGQVDVFINDELIGTAKRFAGGTKWHRTVKDFRGHLFNLYYKTAAEAARAIVAEAKEAR